MTDHNADLKKYVFEARQLDNPNISYVEKLVKKQVDKVIAVLKGSKSAFATTIAKQYREIQAHEKEVIRLKKEQSELIKSVEADYFDPADAVITRVIESIQFVITYTRMTITPAKTKVSVDYEAAMKELAIQLPELDEVLVVLIKKHTKSTVTPAKENPSRLVVRHHDELKGQSKTPAKPKAKAKVESYESINEGPSDDQWVSMYATLAQKRFDKFDILLDKLKTLE